MAVKIKR